MDLVGVLTQTASKVGEDAGTLSNTESTEITATDDVEPFSQARLRAPRPGILDDELVF